MLIYRIKIVESYLIKMVMHYLQISLGLITIELKDRRKVFTTAQSNNSKAGPVYTIPTVIHVIHDDCDGNISMEQILEGLRILNEDFRRLNADTTNTRSEFLTIVGDAEMAGLSEALITTTGGCCCGNCEAE